MSIELLEKTTDRTLATEMPPGKPQPGGGDDVEPDGDEDDETSPT
jgi:hypothetical protein